MRIGLLKQRNGKLIKVRGRTGSIVVDLQCTATPSEVLAAVVEKLYHCNSDLEVTTYKLLCPDGKLVTCIPGGTLEFTAERYKEFMGKSIENLCYTCAQKKITSRVCYYFLTRNILDCNQSNYSSRIIFSCRLFLQAAV